jgi:hypothetical protein
MHLRSVYLNLLILSVKIVNSNKYCIFAKSYPFYTYHYGNSYITLR